MGICLWNTITKEKIGWPTIARSSFLWMMLRVFKKPWAFSMQSKHANPGCNKGAQKVFFSNSIQHICPNFCICLTWHMLQKICCRGISSTFLNISFVPSAAFHFKRKTKKRPWNSSNTWLKFAQIENIIFRKKHR